MNAEEYISMTDYSFKDELVSYVKDKNGKMTMFPETKMLSTYLYCFIAGEYVELQLEE